VDFLIIAKFIYLYEQSPVKDFHCLAESGDSGTEESEGSPMKHAVLSSPGKRTIASSSSAGSDVALHEGAELSPDDNTGTRT